jgi:CheY-like chemotaxis protein
MKLRALLIDGILFPARKPCTPNAPGYELSLMNIHVFYSLNSFVVFILCDMPAEVFTSGRFLLVLNPNAMINSSAREKAAPKTSPILLIGDQPSRAAVIKELLNGIGQPFLIDEAGDRCAAHIRLLERDYEFIVIDVRWSKWTEKELVAEIFRINFHSRILFFTECAHKEFIGGYVGEGAWGFVSRIDIDAADIKRAVGVILDGRNYISPNLLAQLVE